MPLQSFRELELAASGPFVRLLALQRWRWMSRSSCDGGHFRQDGLFQCAVHSLHGSVLRSEAFEQMVAAGPGSNDDHVVMFAHDGSWSGREGIPYTANQRSGETTIAVQARSIPQQL